MGRNTEKKQRVNDETFKNTKPNHSSICTPLILHHTRARARTHTHTQKGGGGEPCTFVVYRLLCVEHTRIKFQTPQILTSPVRFKAGRRHSSKATVKSVAQSLQCHDDTLAAASTQTVNGEPAVAAPLCLPSRAGPPVF